MPHPWQPEYPEGFKRYDAPRPEGGKRNGGSADCESWGGPWVCTRGEGHEGEHQAGVGGGKMIASWPNVKTPAEKKIIITRAMIDAARYAHFTSCCESEEPGECDGCVTRILRKALEAGGYTVVVDGE